MSETRIESISFESAYRQQPVAGYLFTNDSIVPHAILQICHGMSEYILRYRAFVDYFTAHGYVVCGNDHLGHGMTSGSAYPDGFFAPKNGREYVLRDLARMNAIARERYPGLSVVLFGHSMGSFLARSLIETNPGVCDAAIFCGTGGQNSAAGLGIALTALLSGLRGPQYISPLVEKMAFGTYLDHIKTPKTQYDWLSVNEENVQRYLADPKCGFSFTVSAFHELTCLVKETNCTDWFARFPKELPVYLVAGSEDPVGSWGKGPQQVLSRLKAAGVREAGLKLYPGMRHEILNEDGRETVYEDLLAFCEAHTAPRKTASPA